MTPSRVPLIFGTMTIGEQGTLERPRLFANQLTAINTNLGRDAVRSSSLEEAQSIITAFLDNGYTELDTARIYAGGTTESVSRLQHIQLMHAC